MCGICGIVTLNSNVDEEKIKQMTMLLRHRGPDEEGYHIEENVGFGHARLSIIDLASGKQPISNEKETMFIVFNGEIYNYRELKIDLQKKGHKFSTNSDTEVILHLYEDKGEKCLDHLRGMFAFAIWDKTKKELFLARDRIGKKPLYYYAASSAILFASEMKSLLVHSQIKREIDYEGLIQFLIYNYIPAPQTMIKGVFKLEPGYFLKWKDGQLKKEKYWDLNYSNKIKLSETEAIENIKYLIDDAVKIRLESEVPLGCLLSGGIDSSVIVALMRKHITGDLHTFTIGFEEEKFNEIPMARLVAEKFETKHKELIVRPDTIEIFSDLVWHFDEPFGDSSAIPTYYVSKLAKQNVSVVMNGDGGDESFFGYNRYVFGCEKDLMSKWIKLPKMLRQNIISPVLKKLFYYFSRSSNIRRLYYGNLFSVLSNQEKYSFEMELIHSDMLGAILDTSTLKRLPNRNNISLLLNIMREDDTLSIDEQKIRADVLFYLPNDLLVKMDRMSMAHGLESRSPFLDHKVMEFAASLTSDMKFQNNELKYLLRKTFRGLIPDEILNGRKHGFSAPLEKWFKEDWYLFSKELLLSPKAKQRGLINTNFVENILKCKGTGNQSNHAILWALMMIEVWCRTFIDRKDIMSGPISV